jgi:imidazolonepropionase-like amidohydrolase
VSMATYFANVALFDGRSMRTKTGVLVSSGEIAWVGAHARAPKIARAAHEVDGTGATLLPGLIDCHVHLCFDGSADFAGEAAAFTDTLVALKAMRNAAKHLAAGVTSVRDLGGWKTSVIEVGAAIERGMIPGPRVVAAGQALTITGGHGHNIGVARQVDGADAMRKAVREEIRAGARVIKLIATGGVLTPGITADFTAFTPEELEAAVDEAHTWGRRVAAHAIGATGIMRAVIAGVDSIEHGSQIGAEAARLMKESGTFHVPTISAIRGIVEHPDEVPAYAVEKALALTARARDAFRRSLRAGVRHACGTDAGTPFNPHGNAPHEIVSMVEWGMTPLKALRSATSNAADLLGLADVGSVAPGMAADLVLYDEDPVEEIAALLQPAMVMKAGEVVAGDER